MEPGRVREFLRGSGFAFVGTFTNKLFRYLFLLVATRVLSASTFGVFVFLLAVVNLVQRMGMLGLNRSIDYFVPKFLEAGDEGAARSVLLTAIGAITLVGFLLGAVMFFGSPWIGALFNHPEESAALALMGLSVPVYMYQTALRNAFHSVKQIGSRVAVENVLNPTARILLLLALVYFGFDLYGAVGAFIGATVLTAAVGTVLLLRSNRWIIDPDVELFSVRRILGYSLPLSAAVVTAAIIGQIDILLLGVYVSDASVGFYRLAYSVAMLAGMVPPIFKPIVKPLIAERADGSDEVETLYRQTTRWIVVLAVPILVTLTVHPLDTLRVLFGPNYTGPVLTPIVLLLGQGIVLGFGIQSTVVQGIGLTRYVFVSRVSTLVVNLVLDLLLIPEIGTVGAAIGTGAGMVVGALTLFVAIFYETGVHPFDSSYLRAIVMILPTAFVAEFTVFEGTFTTVIATGVVTAVVYGTLVLLSGGVSRADLPFVRAVEEAIGVEFGLLKKVIRYRL